MKKIILTSLVFLGVLGNSFAQNQSYTIKDKYGVQYEDNSVHNFTVHGTFADPIEEAKLYVVAHNDTAADLYVAGEIVEITNTDGTMAQFCIGGPWGNCFFPLNVGGFYPHENGGILPANSTWGLTDYLINLDPTVGASYKVRFTEKNNATGEDIPNTNFFITYVYTGEMGVSDMNVKAVAEVYPTVAKGFTNVNLNENAQVQILNVEGKVVKTTSFQLGSHKLDLSGLSAGIYWIVFKGDSGKTTSIKVVVK
jgi:hypothetical protein